jgi:hypothetical protein
VVGLTGLRAKEAAGLRCRAREGRDARLGQLGGIRPMANEKLENAF